MKNVSIPLDVLRTYGLARDKESAAALDIVHVPSLINRTYVVRSPTSSEPLVLQCLHPVFGPQVHRDIEAVTIHLRSQNFETPRLIRTRAGELWTVDADSRENRVWRALSYIDGITIHKSEELSWLESAAQLLGRFHGALSDFEYEFVHSRPVHDTPRHLANLELVLGSASGQGDREAQALGADLLRHASGVRLEFKAFPRRIVHGDPKLSNVLFRRTPPAQARCMIDLDTLGRQWLAYELGDALRSWCNPAGEDTAAPRIDPAAFEAVMLGYARARPLGMGLDEMPSAVDGVETVSLELASRFAADVIADSYWGWDPTRFASRREHNLLRAKGQLALSLSVREQRATLLGLAERAFRSA